MFETFVPKFKFKKTQLEGIYPRGYLQPGMRLVYKSVKNGEEIQIKLRSVVSTDAMGFREFSNAYSSGNWTEGFLLDRIKDGSCKIVDDGE